MVSLCPFPRTRLLVLAGALLAARCGDTPTRPSTLLPKITCPAPPTAQSLDGRPIAVTYSPATVADGALSVTVVCSPAAGTTFSVGSTMVTCTVTDAQQRTASCSFALTVQPPPPPPPIPRISATKYVAFGDSETEGKLSASPFTLGDPGPTFGYPFKLKTRLEARYTAQAFVMSDEGYGGELVVPTAQLRLPQVLTADAPEVLLLLEGVNDLNTSGASAIPGVIQGLRAMVREAHNRRIIVFLGTLTPQRPGGTPPRGNSATLVQPANDQIRALAAAEGATLVDLYAAFGGSPDPWIGIDGLHPNEAGYDKMAETFFTAIRARLELPAAAPSIRLSR